MTFFSRTSCALVVAASLTLGACQSGPIDPSTMTATEIALRQQETERVRIVQGVATGAAVGAVLGGLTGALVSGGDRDAIIRGALIGGVGGGVAGGVDANRVNQETRQVSSEQSGLRATIESADKSIAYYRRNVSLTSKLIDEQTARVSRNNERLRSGQITPAAYRDEFRTARQNVDLVRRQANNADEDLRDFSRATSGQGSGEVRARERELQAQRDSLRRQVTRLESAYSRVPDEVGLST